MELLVPEPEDLSEEDDFLVPFPIFLETPAINPCQNHTEILSEMIEKCKTIENEDKEYFVEVLRENPKSLPKKLFLKNLEKLVKHNS